MLPTIVSRVADCILIFLERDGARLKRGLQTLTEDKLYRAPFNPSYPPRVVLRAMSLAGPWSPEV